MGYSVIIPSRTVDNRRIYRIDHPYEAGDFIQDTRQLIMDEPIFDHATPQVACVVPHLGFVVIEPPESFLPEIIPFTITI